MDDRHAYCIMAHGQIHQLQRLLDVLDDVRNDIYLHVDKKCKDSLSILHTAKSKLIFTSKRLDVRWSDISQVDAEICLFQTMLDTNNNYNRVHFISGVDLPLKTQDEIHDFFNKHNNEEFINIRKDLTFCRRLKFYHFFVCYRRNHILADYARKLFLLPQLLFVNRLRTAPLKFAYGWNWCSLTVKAIKEIVTTYKKYRYVFLYSTSADELYKQMILYTSGKYKISSMGPLRYILFKKGNPSPKVLTMVDYNNMMASGCLFARKFDERVDNEVISKVIEHIK